MGIDYQNGRMTHTIICPTCSGKGRKLLGKAYSETLTALEQLGGSGSCEQIKDALKASGLLNGSYENTVIHKRMSRLEGMGLVRKKARVEPEQVDSEATQKVWLYEKVMRQPGRSRT